MHKRKKYITITIMVVLIGVLISIVLLKLNKKEDYPEGPSFGKHTYVGTEDGLYYKDYNLMYYDRGVKESYVFCNRPNCQHNNTDCNSYMGEHVNRIMIYGDYLFVCYFRIRNIETDEPTYMEYENTFGIIKVSLDGQEKEILFEETQPGSGAITTIEGIDGKIYYTYYVNDPQKYMKEDYTCNSVYLSCYDLNSEKNQIIGSWDGVNAGISILETDSCDTIYLKLDYFTDGEITLENVMDKFQVEFFSYDIESDELSQCYSSDVDSSRVFFVNENCMYYKELFSEEIVYMKDNGEFDLAIDMINGDGQYCYPYFIVSKDDNDRIILDLRNNTLYVPRDIKKEIPGVLDYDYSSDTLYIDLSCYDHIPDGTVLTYNPVKVDVMDMETYLNEYFIVYEKDNYKGSMILGEEWLDGIVVK